MLHHWYIWLYNYFVTIFPGIFLKIKFVSLFSAAWPFIVPPKLCYRHVHRHVPQIGPPSQQHFG